MYIHTWRGRGNWYIEVRNVHRDTSSSILGMSDVNDDSIPAIAELFYSNYKSRYGGSC